MWQFMEKSLSAVPNLHARSFHWTVPGFPEIIFHSRAMDGILQDALESLTRVPRRGAETGGILLGRKDQDSLVIQDFAPVPSEHRFGRFYRLSETDREHLRAACDAIARRPNGMEVVGFYRSHARDDRKPSAEDAEYLEDHFAEDRRVLLLIRPALTLPTTASFFFWNKGRLEEPVAPAEFPFGEIPAESPAPVGRLMHADPPRDPIPAPIPAPMPARAFVVPPPPTAEMPAPLKIFEMPMPPTAPAPVLPVPVPKLLADDIAAEPRSFRWLAIAAWFVCAVTAGYLSRQWPAAPRVPPPPPAPAVAPAPAVPRVAELPSTPALDPPAPAVVPAPQPPPKPAIESRDRAATPPPQLEVRTILDRWADAIRQGRVDRASAFYAPTARGLARATLAAKLGRARRMDVFRLSHVAVDYPEPGQAVATVREHWQSGVVEKNAGEQSVRLTLRTDGDGWHIVSEQVEKVHWIQKIR
jgi:proteasome lid subunit RPN8/RPN11